LSARERVVSLALLIIAVLGPIFYLAGLFARGLAMLHMSYFRLGFTHVAMSVSAACAAVLLFRRGNSALRVMAGFFLLLNLGSVGLASYQWLQEMQQRFVERAMVPIEPIKAGVLVAPLDDTAGNRQESRALEQLLVSMVRREGLTDYVAVRQVPPISSAEQARRMGEKMRANVVVWKGRESRSQVIAHYYITVVGANETAIALDPVPLLTVLATHDTYVIPNREMVPEGQVPPVATQVVAPTAMGFAYMSIGRPLLAATQFQTAIDVPNLSPAIRITLHNQFAAAMLFLNRDDLALQAYQKSIEVQPNAKAYSGLGTVALARRDWATAARTFRQAIRLDPYDPTAYCGMGILYNRERNMQQAMSAYYQAIALRPEESVPYALLGMGYELLGDATKARDAYRLSEQHAGVNAGLHVAVAERAADIVRNPPTAVPTSTPRPIPTATPVPARARYTIKRGDTLGTIAAEFDVKVADLIRVNDIKHPDSIYIGQELIIPEPMD
jgi:hypothetical protein